MQNKFKLSYPYGGPQQFVSIKKPNGTKIKGLPFQSNGTSYIVVMNKPSHLKPIKRHYKFNPTPYSNLDQDDDIF